MKKTLIAIAALAATGAFAQSTVAIDGAVDAGYVSHNYKGNTVSGVDRNLSATSQFNFRVTQDLGGGMKANWRSETDFVVTSNAANQGSTVPTAASFMNGEQLLGLSGGFGKAEFGALNNAALFAHLYAQPFGTAIGSGFGQVSGSAIGAVGSTTISGTATANVRLDNSMRYTTPSFSGVTAALLLRPKQANGAANFNASLGQANQAAATDFNINYNAGPINATFVTATNDATSYAGNKGSYSALTGNYNMGALTVYAGLQNLKLNNTAGANLWGTNTFNIAAQYDMGANRFMANYAKVTDKSTVASSSKTGMLSLGYEYALSKTTSAVARYESIKDDLGVTSIPTFATAATSTSRNRMGVGLRMAF